jgi:hypothetical protein
MSPEDSWWYSCLQRGWIVQSGGLSEDSDEDPVEQNWLTEIEIERVHRSYIHHCDQTGVRHKKSAAQLGSDLRRLVKSIVRIRTTIGSWRPYVYRLPTLEACRRSFERRIGTRIDWESGQPLTTPSIDDEGSWT